MTLEPMAEYPTYESNTRLINELDDMERKDEKLSRLKRRWKVIGAGASLAPLVAAGTLMLSDGEKLTYREKVFTDFYAVIASALGGIITVGKYQETKSKAYKNASLALKLSLDLNGGVMPWINRRLADKQAEEEADEAMRSNRYNNRNY